MCAKLRCRNQTCRAKITMKSTYQMHPIKTAFAIFLEKSSVQSRGHRTKTNFLSSSAIMLNGELSVSGPSKVKVKAPPAPMAQRAAPSSVSGRVQRWVEMPFLDCFLEIVHEIKRSI